jgi:putative component of membrane protein insertase Oxa1/YidC/SpoIIIJ protein YidD
VIRRLTVLALFLMGCATAPTTSNIELGEPFAPGMYPVAPDGQAHQPRKPAMHPLAAGPIQSATWVAYRGYQSTFSRVDGATCRFRPTCSRLAYQAVSERGLAGVPIAFARLQRFHSGVHNYPGSHPPHLHDPLANYTFTNRRPKLDDHDAYENRAHAWYQHVRATRRR